MVTTVLVTGGAGFIGHHLVDRLLTTTDFNVIVLDRLDYAGNLHRINDIVRPKDKKRIKFVFHDLKAELPPSVTSLLKSPSRIFHLAANSHVNRSIDDPMTFVQDNVVGTCNILNYARNLDNLEVFFHMSTDEVFGPATSNKDCVKGSPEGGYLDWDRYNSGSPYAASKCGAEELCVAYHNTYKLPVVIAHCSNVFGERQDPEKYIPLCVGKILKGESVTVHCQTDNSSQPTFGIRDYIYAKNVADAVIHISTYGEDGNKYNIPGQMKLNNLEVAQRIAVILGKKLHTKFVDPYTMRPGGDFDYDINGSSLFKLGYEFDFSFYSFTETVLFTAENPQWLK